ncbi:MAG: hypothetical protein WBL48_04400, partial [Pseudolabrys sp.]
IKKEAARGSAAIELLPSKETLSSAYLELRARIDQVVEQAKQERSLNVAISGLNSIRQTWLIQSLGKEIRSWQLPTSKSCGNVR